MRLPECTIDTSCIIALDYLDLVPLLNSLYSKVLLPKAVRKELFRRRRTKDRVRSLCRRFRFLQNCDDYDAVSITWLHPREGRSAGKDVGEKEAILQAAGRGAGVLVDDQEGRALAQAYGLEIVGTLGILRRLFDMQLVSRSAISAGLRLLSEKGVRLPADAVSDLLRHAGANVEP